MDRAKSDIKQIIVHCSASGPKTKLEDIRKWHKAKGWKDIGYHYVIEYDGMIRMGRPWDTVGAHCEGHNSDSIGVCLVGGLDSLGHLYRYSPEQMKALRVLLEGIRMTFGNISIKGHYDYSIKMCPCFDVKEYIKSGNVVYKV